MESFAGVVESFAGVVKSFEGFTSFQDSVEGAAGVSNCMPVGFAYIGASGCRGSEEENKSEKRSDFYGALPWPFAHKR